jgi:hypothetical protein
MAMWPIVRSLPIDASSWQARTHEASIWPIATSEAERSIACVRGKRPGGPLAAGLHSPERLGRSPGSSADRCDRWLARLALCHQHLRARHDRSDPVYETWIVLHRVPIKGHRTDVTLELPTGLTPFPLIAQRKYRVSYTHKQGNRKKKTVSHNKRNWGEGGKLVEHQWETRCECSPSKHPLRGKNPLPLNYPINDNRTKFTKQQVQK